MASANDVRAVLQYVPQFRGKTFVVLIEAGILPEPAVAETLLDLKTLQDVGVKLVLGVLGGDVQDLYDWTVEVEMKVAKLRAPLDGESAVAEAKDILARGQAAVVDASKEDVLGPEVVSLAKGVGAVKVIALLGEAILIDGEPVPAVRAIDAVELSKSAGVTHPELLRAAAAACAQGVPRVHVLNGRRQGVLVEELFSNEGVGTMVHADSYREIRTLCEEDIPELLGMIGRVVRRTRLIARTYEDIVSKRDDYYVMTIDDNVVGCVAMHPYPGTDCGEVACLYVKMSHEGRGYGIDLVNHAEEVAKQKGIPHVFALTTRAAEFFQGRLGYTEATVEALPDSRRRQFEASGRDSKIFVKNLGPS